MSDLQTEGMRALIKVTNSQFAFWEMKLKEETLDQFPQGNLMNYWVIMSQLALHTDFQMEKKVVFTSIPNLEPETVRKYVSTAEKLGLVQTVRTKGRSYLQLTGVGQRTVLAALTRWAQEFGRIQSAYFAPK